jgi:epoxyqueuosine reductase QueG
MTNEEQIKGIILNKDADLCGIANIDRFGNTPAGFHPLDIYKDCKSVIVLAKRLPKGLAHVNPRIVYNHANELNVDAVDKITYEASLAIEQLGCIAVPLPCDGPYDYWEKDNLKGKGLLSMRHAAVLAGLGSMGKNTLFINRYYGNFLRLGVILTNLDLQSDPLSEELCIENCRLCLDNCPVKALDGKTANQKLCRPHTYSTNDRGFGVVNCNQCRTICPRRFGSCPPPPR